jgi:hypothetical protein
VLFVDEHRVGQWADFLRRFNRVLRQIRLGRDILQRVDPGPSIFVAAGVLRDGDDLKILVFQLLVDCLPAWQVKAAPSPRGPRDQQDFFSTEIREPVLLAVKIGQGEVRGLQRSKLLALV